MSATNQHRGIERKILTSILWVSTVPVIFALCFGYFTVRWGRSQETLSSLENSARQTGAGVRLNTDAILRASNNLAQDIDIINGLIDAQDRGSSATAISGPLMEEIPRRLEQEISSSRGPTAIRLITLDGRVIVSTDSLAADDFDPSQVSGWLQDKAPSFIDFGIDEQTMAPMIEVIAPVLAPEGETIVGFIWEKVDISAVTNYAFGYDPFEKGNTTDYPNFQIAFSSDDDIFGLELRSPQPAVAPRVVRAIISPELRARLLADNPSQSATFQVSSFQNGSNPMPAFVAYYRFLEQPHVYIIVYRPSSLVYSNINMSAALALVLCSIFIGVMCLNAYRNVHNNIVRPVSLLNEGAQIIGQGDLELKLKIDTGDEIDELATSFNKMALDLKRNIGHVEESEERYRSLVTSMRDGIYHADSKGRLVFMNQAGIEIFGFANEKEAAGQGLRALFADEDDLKRILSELAKNRFIERSRIMMKHCHGRTICVELSANQVFDDDGKVNGVEGIFRDVTKSVELEQEAKDRSERIAAINQIANVINSSLEAGGLYESLVVEIKRLVDFDYAALALLNDTEDAFTTQQLWPAPALGLESGASYPVDDETNCAAWVTQERTCLLVEDLQNPHSPFSNQFPSSTVSCTAVPLYASGRILGTLNLGAERRSAFSRHDVEVLEQVAPHVAVAIRNAKLLENLQLSLEEVTRAREKLHEANEELKTLDEMKTNLLSNVSHELRTPLVSVMGYTDMILNEKVGPVNDLQGEYLRISLRNIDKLVTLIENLLDFSRLHHGTETLVFDTFNLVDCARASIQVIQPVAESRAISVILDAPDEKILVEGDKGKLGQVFNNLLSNAVKFNQSEGRVTVQIVPASETIEVIVSDTGIGIPEDALDKIFTRFYQFDSSSTRKYGGTGIGLAIVQDIARLHGSRIIATSGEEGGSTFRFALPNPAARKGADSEATQLPLPTETQLLVGLVTRDRALLAQVHSLLEREGMEVINATNVSNAASLVQRHHPNCLIADVDDTPHTNGILGDLLSNPVTSRLPIIIISNNESEFDRHRGLVAARLKRDFRKSTLLSSIRYAIDQGPEATEPFGNKVLCVDDDPEILTFMRRCLEPEGYEVDAVSTGEEAIDRVADRDYGLVLLDIAMPGLDGWETCRHLKNNPDLVGIKICMVTAKPIDTSKERRRKDGADGFLLKPFRPEDLLELVRGMESLQTSPRS
jgi:PAS domain S-box-containing protein